jgi:8-oxo-dGTP pyrophosphatase MutT (NUDIX family)
VSASVGEGKRLVVGAVVIDPGGRAFVQKRSSTRRVFPDCWDIVGGHVEPGEVVEDALAREIYEETGWTLRRVVARLGQWTWEAEGEARQEIDFLVEVGGDLAAPRLEREKHTEFRWIDAEELPVVLEERAPGNELVYQILVKAFALARRLH